MFLKIIKFSYLCIEFLAIVEAKTNQSGFSMLFALAYCVAMELSLVIVPKLLQGLSPEIV